ARAQADDGQRLARARNAARRHRGGCLCRCPPRDEPRGQCRACRRGRSREKLAPTTVHAHDALLPRPQCVIAWMTKFALMRNAWVAGLRGYLGLPCRSQKFARSLLWQAITTMSPAELRNP